MKSIFTIQSLVTAPPKRAGLLALVTMTAALFCNTARAAERPIMTYRLDSSVTNSAYAAQISASMAQATATYNRYGVFAGPSFGSYPIVAKYSSSVPTANGSGNGTLNFGTQRNVRVTQHEISHILGCGQYSQWTEIMGDDKIWHGDYAQAQLRAFDGADAELHGDKSPGHFYTYGLNYDQEFSATTSKRNVIMVAALRRDMGIGYAWPPVNGPANGTYRLTPKNATGSALRATGAGNNAAVDIAKYGSSANQQFILQRQSDGTYEIKTSQTGNRNLNVANVNVGTDVQLSDDTSSLNQHWIIEPNGDGYFRITASDHALRLLETADAGTADGTLAQLGEYTEVNSKGVTDINQFWKLEPVAGVPAQTIAYWQGDVNANWNYKSGGNTNWANGYNRTADLGRIPDSLTTVLFPDVSTERNTILGQDFSIPGLIFDSNSTTVIGGTNVLTIGADGITLTQLSNNATINTTGQVVLNGSQVWTNDSNHTLIVSSPVNGAAKLTLAGAGGVVLGGDNLYSGGTTNGEGVLQIGQGGTTGSVIGDIANGGTVIFNRSNDSTFSGVISGNGGLGKRGAGILTLGKTNPYKGDTTIGFNQGAAVLRAAADGALGTGDINFDGSGNTSTARLELVGGVALPNAIGFAARSNGSVAIENEGGNNTLSGLMTLGAGGSFYTIESDAGSLDLTNTGTVTVTTGKVLSLQGAGGGSFAGILAGAGGFTKSGAGTWTLSGNNSYTGATTIVGGTLLLKSAERINNASDLTLAGGTLATGGFNETLGDINLSQNSAIDFGSGASTVKFGSIGTFASGKTLNLTNYSVGADRFFIGTTASLSAAQLAQISFNGTAAQQLSTGEITPVGAAAFYWRGDVNSAWNSNSSNNTNWATSAAGTTDTAKIPGANDSVIFAASNATNLPATVLGADISIKDLTVSTATGLTVGGTNKLTLGNNGLAVAAGAGATAINTSGAVVLGAAQTWGNNSSSALTIASAISGVGPLTKDGTGTLIFSGANVYTGGTTINSGTLQIGGGGTSGSVAGNIANNDTLLFNRSDDTTFAGVISGSGDVVKQGASILTLDKTNTYSGITTIGVGQDAAVVRAAANGALGTGTLVLDASGNGSKARLELAGGISLPNAIGFTARNNGTIAIENISGNNTLSGLMTLGAGGSFYTVQSDAGSLALTNSGTVTVTANKVFMLQGEGNGTFAGILAGAGGFTKSGAGTWAISGANSYTGATILRGGTLQLQSSERIPDASNLTMSGVLATGGFNETLGQLTLSDNSSVDFGNANSTVKFSGVGSFSSGKTLTLANWTQGSDHFFIGTSAALTAAQLAQIKFDTTAAQQLNTGEIVPVATAPSAPSNLTATAGNAQITLKWDAVTGATSYNVKRALASGGPYTTIKSNVTGTTYIDTNLTNGTTYFYVVTATGAGGESANSNEASATPVSTVAPNVAPVASNDSYSANQNVTLNIAAPGVLSNDSDADKDALSVADNNAATAGVQPVSGPANGTLTLNANGSFSYQPKAGYSGSDSFSYKVTDGQTLSNTATVSITVKPIEANAQSVVTDEDISAAIVLSGSGAENQVFSYNVATNPAHGTLDGIAPNLTYMPSADFNGADSFTFTVSDGTSSSAPATVTITVNPVNDAPVAASRTEAVGLNTAKAITLTATDVESDTLTYSVVTAPKSGTLSGTAPNLTYTPNADYKGSDSFTFKANDGTADSNVATITLSVGNSDAAPVAANQSVTTNEDTTKAIVLSATDADGDALTYTVVAGPTNGGLSGTAPNLTYTPAVNYNGADSFTFKANDGKNDSNLATVSITVNAVNDAPFAIDQDLTTAEDTAKTIVLSATDLNNDNLIYQVVDGPSKGKLSGTAPNLTYTPNANFNGSDSFTFKANDGTADSNVANVTLTVTAVNDAPVANAANASVNRNTATGIMLTASDVDGDKLTYQVVAGPTNGKLSGTAPDLTYTPNAGYSGNDSFTFKANDGTVDSNVATLTLTVGGNNVAPVAMAQSVTTNEDAAKAIVLGATDANNDALTYKIVANPANGKLSGTASNLTYTPNANFNGSDSFTFTANDGTLDSNTATIALTVTAVNDAPSFVVGGDQTVAENAAAQSVAGFVKNISAGAANESAQKLNFVVTNDKAALFAVAPAISADGTLTYTLARNQSGKAKITVVLRDNGGGQDTSAAQSFNINVTVNPIGFSLALTPKNVLTRDRVTATPVITDGAGVTYVYQWFVNGKSVQSGAANTLELSKPGFGDAGDLISVTATASKANGATGTASQSVTVSNSAPFAFSGTARATAGIMAKIPFQLYRNPGGADSDDDALTYKIVGEARGGDAAFAVNEQGVTELRYTPRKEFVGVDVIRFAAIDSKGAAGNVATLSVDVKIAPRVRPTTQDANASTFSGVSVDVPVSGSSADGTPVTFKRVGGPRDGAGEFVQLSDGTTVLRYTSRSSFVGVEEVRFVALTSEGYPSEVATIRILVNASDSGARGARNPAPSASDS